LKMVDPDKKKRQVGVESDHYKTELLSDPSKKTAKESINISDMSNKSKSEFDRLYEFAMEGEDDLDLGGGGDLGGGELGDDLDMGDDEELGGDLKSQLLELRDKIDSVIDSLGGDEGDDLDLGDDLGDDEEDLEALGAESHNPHQEAIVSEPTPKVLGGHGDRSHPDQGKGPWSKTSSGAYDGHGGTAEHGSIPEEPSPKPLGGHSDRKHKDAGNTGSGSNKVKHPKKGKPGDHLLGS
jgi:hypothetical protein